MTNPLARPSQWNSGRDWTVQRARRGEDLRKDDLMPTFEVEIQHDDERLAGVRASNPAAENGHDQEPGPLTWVNSMRLALDPERDAVHCAVSVGDPRGAFCFTVRRTPQGHLLIEMPHPNETMPHMRTAWQDAGVLKVVHDGRDGRCPVDFSDEQ